MGDTGTIYVQGKLLNVYDTKKADGVYIHLCTVAEGRFSVGDAVTADISGERRKATARNHSAAHLLQAALRRVLGDHVSQAGSYVSDKVCRFDFTHFAALTEQELSAVEALVNANILSASPIVTTETDMETAQKSGAMALFGEKYGKTVRMVQMGAFSTELCGGTHCANTGEIGLFKIVSETSVAAGVRRVEAVTGTGVLQLIAEKDALLRDVARELKSPNLHDVAKRAAQLQLDLSASHKEIDALNAKIAASNMNDVLAGAVDVGGLMLVCAHIDRMAPDVARTLTDDIKAKYENAVVVLAVTLDGKLNFVAAAGKEAVAKGAHAGRLVGAVAAVTGGKGGGRPDNAMAGGQDHDKIESALSSARSVLEGMIQ